jgi:hypothetical protein
VALGGGLAPTPKGSPMLTKMGGQAIIVICNESRDERNKRDLLKKSVWTKGMKKKKRSKFRDKVGGCLTPEEAINAIFRVVPKQLSLQV